MKPIQFLYHLSMELSMIIRKEKNLYFQILLVKLND